MRLPLTYFLLLLLLFSGCRQPADEPAAALVKAEAEANGCRFTVAIDRETLELTDTLRLTLQARVPSETSCHFESIADGLDGFRLQAASPITCSRDGDAWLFMQTLDVEPLLADAHALGPFTAVAARDDTPDEATPIRLTTAPFPVDVKMPPPEVWQTLDIDDKTGMSAIRPIRTYILLGLLGAGLAAVLAWLACFFLRHRRRHAPPPLPPHVKALRRLDALLSEGLPGQGESKAFYHRISELLRTYIEERFDIRAPRQTTEEFLHRLSGQASPLAPYRRQLQDFLDFCDLVKFAELAPSMDDVERTTATCRTFITTTATAPEENPHVPL